VFILAKNDGFTLRLGSLDEKADIKAMEMNITKTALIKIALVDFLKEDISNKELLKELLKELKKE
jgi:hypothetical protein